MYLLVAGSLLVRSLVQDARLSAAHPVRELVVSARTLCTDLGKTWGVPLTCDERISDDLVILVSKPRSLAELMSKVSEHFAWKWTPVGDGYRLDPTPEFLKEARYGRAEWILQNLAPLREKAKQDLTEMAGQDDDARNAEIEALNKKLEGHEEEQTDAVSQLRLRMQHLENRGNRMALPILKTVALLTDAQLVQMFDEPLFLSSEPGPLEAKLPQAAVQAVGPLIQRLESQRRAQEEAQKKAFKDQIFLEGGLRGGLMGAMAPPREASILRVVLNDSYSARGRLVTNKGEVVLIDQMTLPSSNDQEAERPFSPGLKAALLTKYPSDPVDKQADPIVPFAQWLARVGDKVGKDVISDANDLYPYFAPFNVADKDSRTSLLSGLACRESNGWLEVRDPAWAKYRDELCPRNLLPSMRESLDLMPLNDRAAVVSKLTIAQIASPCVRVDAQDYRFLKAWQATAETTKTALRAGRKVPLGAFAPEVLDYLKNCQSSWDDAITRGGVYANYSGGTGGGGCFEEPEFNPATPPAPDIDDPRAVLSPPEVSREMLFAAIYPRFVDPKGYASIQIATIPGIFDATAGESLGPHDLMSPSTMEERGWEQEQWGELMGHELHPASIQAIRVSFVINKDLTLYYKTMVTTYEPRKISDPTTWPPALVARVKVHEQKRAQEEQEFRGGTPPP